jgi:DNA-binding transcriptional regulator GbsR (MarR family)
MGFYAFYATIFTIAATLFAAKPNRSVAKIKEKLKELKRNRRKK